jgi:hypothetical protein
MSAVKHDAHNKPVVFGVALLVGIISLVGGILMFIAVVPIDIPEEIVSGLA